MNNTITLPIPPSLNAIWKKHGNRTYLTPEAKAFKLQAGWIARGLQHEMLTGNVCVWVDIYRERKAGDLDNFFKLMFDSMQGILYKNDKQIVEIHARMFDDKSNPRAMMSVAEVAG
jgi:crossover junction endodeoxyribonuclease RusA